MTRERLGRMMKQISSRAVWDVSGFMIGLIR
jgi:hypothetical protein